MSKMSLAWHEECLVNAKHHLSCGIQNVLKEISRLRRFRKENRFREWQIAEAKRRGLTAFDQDRLGVKRRAKIVK